jgi:hypothetical protein
VRARGALLACLCAWGALSRASDIDVGPTSHAPTSQENSQIQDYTRTLSKDWLKQYLDIDIDAIGQRMRTTLWQNQNPTAAATLGDGSGGGAASSGSSLVTLHALDVALEPNGDVRRLQSELGDIPFAVRLNADSGFFGEALRVKTSIYVPLSPRDQMRAEARLPLPSLTPEWMGSLLNWGGFDSPWDFKSSYSNQMGVSSVQTGLGTQWMKLWTLNYELKYRFGQDNYEESQWLRLGRSF